MKRSQLRPFGAGLVLAALGVAIGLGACTPGTDISASESDVVTTQFDPEVDFGALRTFIMPDSVVHITDDGEDDPNLKRQFDAQILNSVAGHFEALGYERLPGDAPDTTNPPDFVVLVGATSSDFFYSNWGCGGYWGWWPGWGYYPPGYWGPGYGCYYPPSVSYAYTTGTLFVLGMDPDGIDVDEQLFPIGWAGAINGVLNDSSASIADRLDRNIDQMFAQSPYLGVRE